MITKQERSFTMWRFVLTFGPQPLFTQIALPTLLGEPCTPCSGARSDAIMANPRRCRPTNLWRGCPGGRTAMLRRLRRFEDGFLENAPASHCPCSCSRVSIAFSYPPAFNFGPAHLAH